MTQVVTLLGYGCNRQAIVAAFGFDERKIKNWEQRAGLHCEDVHGHVIGDSKLDLQHVQADEIRAKIQGAVVWIAMALMVSTRLWLGGAISTRRDKKLIQRLADQIQAIALCRPLVLAVDGLPSYVGAFRRAFRAKVPRRGQSGRCRLVSWPDIAIVQVTIDTFTTDMWDGYLQAADDFVQEHDDVKGEIVVDGFHVAQNYRGGFDSLRKQEFKRLKQELSAEGYDQDCKGMLWVLRKNHAALNPEERQRLRILFTHTPLLHQAYTFREELTAIFERPYTLAEAERAILAWCHKVNASPVRCYDRFIKTLQKYWQYIRTPSIEEYQVAREGLNNKIKTIKRRCYGINKVSNLFQNNGLQHLL